MTGESKSERDWMELYQLAEQYFHEHGDLLIPGDYVLSLIHIEMCIRDRV